MIDIMFQRETIQHVVQLLGGEKFVVRSMHDTHDAAPGADVKVT